MVIMNKRGQTATESTFVVLFIATAIVAIFAMTTSLSSDIGHMAEARAKAQGIATELTITDDITTYIIRLDEVSTTSVNIFVVSDDCNSAETALRSEINISTYTCNITYTDVWN
jgi:uncharacterized protein (UPF0333 family)